MTFTTLPLSGSYLINAPLHIDERGSFSRFYCKDEFKKIEHNKDWVQLNHSVTSHKATIRGLHFQKKPFSEIKLVKCIAGSVFDVIVDLREGSTSFLQWFGTELSAENKRMLYIPEGFAHGFQCLTNDCQLIYLHSEYYNPQAEIGLLYSDPLLSIDWPLPAIRLSPRDAAHPFLDENFKGI